jgi:hypothetical protein
MADYTPFDTLHENPFEEVQPLRRYVHPRGDRWCRWDGVVEMSSNTLGAGPICPSCGVRYWTEEKTR